MPGGQQMTRLDTASGDRDADPGADHRQAAGAADCCGTGVFSERQASVVADQLIARHGRYGAAQTYDGKGNLLHRVRSRPGRPCRGNLPQRRAPERAVR
jgi:hypothetical protein